MTVKTIVDLKPDVENARQHNPRNIGMIADSLQEVGAARSIVIDEDNIIIAGNGVIEAAAQVGIENVRIIEADGNEIIAVRRSGLTPEQKRRLAYFDNRTAELATWDAGQIVRDLEAEINLSGIWSPQEFEDLVGDALKGFGDEPPEPQIDRAEELREIWDTRRGQIWEIPSKTVAGKCHKIMCGDSTSEEDVARLMGGQCPLLTTTDPPYGVELDQGWRDRCGINRLGRAQSDTIEGDAGFEWVQALDYVSDTIYLWHAAKYEVETYSALVERGFEIRQQIIWVKNIATLSRAAYHWRHEPCWYAVRKGKTAAWYDGHAQTTVWEASSPKHIMSGSQEEKQDHPTQKPALLFEIPLRNHLRMGEMVYDPFLGSGTTMAAAETLARIAYGCDVEPKYIAVTLERMQDMGLEPRLVNQCAN